MWMDGWISEEVCSLSSPSLVILFFQICAYVFPFVCMYRFSEYNNYNIYKKTASVV